MEIIKKLVGIVAYAAGCELIAALGSCVFGYIFIDFFISRHLKKQKESYVEMYSAASFVVHDMVKEVSLNIINVTIFIPLFVWNVYNYLIG